MSFILEWDFGTFGETPVPSEAVQVETLFEGVEFSTCNNEFVTQGIETIISNSFCNT